MLDSIRNTIRKHPRIGVVVSFVLCAWAFQQIYFPPERLLELAISHGKVDKVSSLWAKLSPDSRTEGIVQAILLNEMEVFDFMLGSGVNVSSQISQSHMAPLHFACQEGHVEMVKKLVAKGADVNQPIIGGRNDGIRPVHVAIGRGHREVVLFLLSQSTLDLERTLTFAASYDRPEMIEILLEKGGVDVNELDGYPLRTVCANGDARTARTLLEHQADVNLAAESGKTALLMAPYSGETEVLSLLLAQKDINLFVVDNEGRSLFHLLVENDDIVFFDMAMNAVFERTDLWGKPSDSLSVVELGILSRRFGVPWRITKFLLMQNYNGKKLVGTIKFKDVLEVFDQEYRDAFELNLGLRRGEKLKLTHFFSWASENQE